MWEWIRRPWHILRQILPQSTIQDIENNLEIIKQAEDELNDLYHECELADPKDMYKGYLVYKAIREVRIRRRNAKQENEILKDMYDLFKAFYEN